MVSQIDKPVLNRPTHSICFVIIYILAHVFLHC